MNRNGYFGPVCDDGWSDHAATVVCKQLGYSYGYAYASSEWGTVPSTFAMDEVRCTGNEKALQDCIYETQDDCGSHEGAGVHCSS